LYGAFEVEYDFEYRTENPMAVEESMGPHIKTLNDVEALLYVIFVCIGLQGVL